MKGWSRQLGGWIVAIGMVGVLAIGLTVRGGQLSAGEGSPAPSPSADAAVAEASATSRPTRRPTPEPTATETPNASTPAPSPTPLPATPTPAPVAAAPPPPPAATPSPAPVHDDEPVLLTQERVAGAFGSTLTIGDYQVRAIRKTSPSTHECATWPGTVAFEVTIWYAGPVESVHFDVAGLSSSACYDLGAVGAAWVGSGVTADVFVTNSGGPSLAGKPLTVYISPEGGPHSMAFTFN